MPGEKKAGYKEWLYKAGEDELSTQAILKEGGSPSTACFLSQQLAEKCLKALLAFFRKPFPKVHDLLTLETLLSDDVAAIGELHDALTHLNRYYIETRYPGDYPEFTWDEAKEAFGAALQVKKFVLGQLSS